jgi:peptidoglycan/xylan/chitin deacetylase (PgdA/CDA1 family)
MYHSIDTNSADEYRRWVVPPDQFARQIKLLAEHDYHPITVSGLVSAIIAQTTLPPRTVVITFDDGLRDFLTGAMPVLQQYHFPATLFVVTGYVGSTSRWLQHLGEGGRPMLNWQELKEISACGIECGAHTNSHPQLDIISSSVASEEIRSSKRILEDRLGRAVHSFAYPHGYANWTTRRLVRDAGFTSACRVRHALSSTEENVFALSRIIMTRDIKEDYLLALLDGTGLPIAPPLERIGAFGWRLARRFSRWAQTLSKRYPP